MQQAFGSKKVNFLLFPQVLPETDTRALWRRMKGPIKPAFLKIAKIGLQMATAERIAAKA